MSSEQIDQAVRALHEWQQEGGLALCMAAPATDGVQTLDNADWLAGLEQACGGSVRVAWAMRPEMYFQTAE